MQIRQYSDSKFLKKANYIIKSVKANLVFATAMPAMKDIEAARDAYDENLTLAEGLGTQNVENKNVSRKALEKLLAQMGTSIMFIAMGDETTLISSGYDLTKERQPRQADLPGVVKLKNGPTSGTMKSIIKRGNNTNFVHEITDALLKDDATVWIQFPARTAKYTFTSLVPGRQYWVRVGVVCDGNVTAYSTIGSFFAQ